MTPVESDRALYFEITNQAISINTVGLVRFSRKGRQFSTIITPMMLMKLVAV
jgi:hypothetical protein